MTKNILKFLVAGFMLTGFFSCKKNNVAIDVDTTIPPEAARFTSTKTSDAFYVLSAPGGGSTYKIPIGITTVSNTDRQLQFTYSSPTGAAAGTQYTAPTTITIPAGKAVDTLTIQGLFAGYPTGRRDTLKIAIAKGNGIAANAYNNTFTLIMQKYCNVVLADLNGAYTKTRETNSAGGSPYGPYTSNVLLTPIVGQTTKANITFTNFWDSGITATGTVDWTSPSNFTVTIPRQYTGLDYDVNQPIDVRTSPGQPNTFSSCDQTFSLTVDFIVNNYPTVGSSAYYSQNYKIYYIR